MPKHYDPVKESSPGLKSVDPGQLSLLRPWFGDALACPCGCGEAPRGKKATFVMGHDARLKGMLMRAHLAGVKVAYYRAISGTPDMTLPAIEWAEHFGESFVAAIREAEKRRQKANLDVVREAKRRHDQLIRIGRWPNTGQVAAIYRTAKPEIVEVKFVTKLGERATARVPKSSIQITPTPSTP